MFLSVFRGHFALENFSQASKVQARYTLLHFDSISFGENLVTIIALFYNFTKGQ